MKENLNQLGAIKGRFLLLTEKINIQKIALENTKERIALNQTFSALNKQLREVIKLNVPEISLQMQRYCLQFTHETYRRESDVQSLMVLNKIEEQFRLVRNDEEYRNDVERGLKIEKLLKEPSDIVEQFVKQQRVHLSKFSGFESPAEKQFMLLQKDMLNAVLKEYKLFQQQALGLAKPTQTKSYER